jgi:hypothetical protein
MHESAAVKSRNTARADAIFNLTSLLFVIVLGAAGLMSGCSASTTAAANAASQGGPNQLSISPLTPRASLGVSYNAVMAVTGGSAPYSFAIASGGLPPGLSLNPSTGSVTGMPTVVGTYNCVISVTSSRSEPSEETRAMREPVANPAPLPSPGMTSGSASEQIVVSSTNSPGISISPTSVTVVSQGQQLFAAQMSGTASTGVTWSASVGSISSSGLYIAPQVSANKSAVVTATSTSNPTLQASAALTVTPVTTLAIANSALPQGNVSTPYIATLSATGGVAPYQWSLSSGSLPSGIQLQATSGAITGMTGVGGSYSFTAKVADSSGQSASVPLSLTISSSSAGGYDGPAQLPLIYIETAMSNTPAPGNTTIVNAGGDLQTALNNANCGDTIQLQAGATFSGVFKFPAKSCDDNHWIIVRTSSPDSALPPEGTRLTPCYAGVSSLPGRPAFHCASTQNVLAKLLMNAAGSGPVYFQTGANHYRLLGLEITRSAGTGIVYALASAPDTGATANNLILDRVWLHGTAQDDTKKGFQLGGMSYASTIDSYLNDMHCVSISGTCTDASAVGGGSGDPTGPFKIVDNFLEASGENVLFGGAQASVTPADIQISQNHFFKPLIWLKGQPGFVGGKDGNAFIVKNLFELKNAQRVLLEANIMEYSWGGFSQNGYAILITPANQSESGGRNVCPTCQVTDVTIRYNSISHVGGALQIGNLLSDNGGAAMDGERYSIHDVTIDDINNLTYAGSGNVAEIENIATAAPLLQNVSINHLTVFAPRMVFSVGAEASRPMANFNFTNSIFLAGTYPVWSTGGSTNCANADVPLTTFDACFAPYSFTNNVIIATPSQYPSSVWPTGNFFPASASTVQFVNYNNGTGGNYQLLTTSPYHNAGTDGKDLGADVATIVSETTGVY